MGGITLENAGKKVSSAMNLVGDQRGQTYTYQTLVREANKQAQRIHFQEPEEEMYLLRSAAERKREQTQQYRQQLETQKAALAAAGVSAQSATVGQLIENNELRALLDQQALTQDFENSLAQNRRQNAEKIRQLQEKVDTYHRDYRQSKNKWKLGSSLVSLFTQR